MDLEKLRRASQEGNERLRKIILEICDPKQIADEVMNKLEKNAEKAAKIGKREASCEYLFWDWIDIPSRGAEEKGPLAGLDNRIHLSPILFEMVEEHITNPYVEVEFITSRHPHISCDGIMAAVMW